MRTHAHPQIHGRPRWSADYSSCIDKGGGICFKLAIARASPERASGRPVLGEDRHFPPQQDLAGSGRGRVAFSMGNRRKEVIPAGVASWKQWKGEGGRRGDPVAWVIAPSCPAVGLGACSAGFLAPCILGRRSAPVSVGASMLRGGPRSVMAAVDAEGQGCVSAHRAESWEG